MGLPPNPCDGMTEFFAKMIEIASAEVVEFDVLEVRPDAFVRVEVRGVPGKALKLNALGGTVREERLGLLASVDRRAVPDDEDLAADNAKKMREEGNDGERVERLVLDAEVELACRGDGADDREVI